MGLSERGMGGETAPMTSVVLAALGKKVYSVKRKARKIRC